MKPVNGKIPLMKSYIVYYNGVEVKTIKAGSHNAAEKKAKKIAEKTAAACNCVPPNVSVAYTEV